MFSINELVGSLLNVGNRLAREGKPVLRPDGGSTTIRLDPELRHFLDSHSRAMGGASLQHVVSMILNGVMRASMEETAAMRVDRIRNRIFELFDRHGIDVPTMSEILQDMGCPLSRDALVEKLDNDLLDRLEEMFSVERDWLLGQQPYINHVWKRRWYGDSFKLIERVIDLKTRGDVGPRIWMFTRGRFDKNTWQTTGHDGDNGRDIDRVGIVVEMRRHTKVGTEFSTFESWGDEPWFHIPTRTEFRAVAKLLSDPPDEMRDTYGSAFRSEYINGTPYSWFFPSDDINAVGIALKPAVYDSLFRENSITVHEALSFDRGIGAGWSLMECARGFNETHTDHDAEQVQKHFGVIVGYLDRSKPWLPPEERPDPMVMGCRKMEDIVAATKAERDKVRTTA